MRRLFVLTFLLIPFSSSPAQPAKPLEIDPADLARLADKTIAETEKKAIHEKYNDKVVRYTAKAHATVLAPTVGNGFVTVTEGKTKAEAMVFPAKDADFKKVEAVLATKKSHALIVVEGKAEFPGPLDMPAVTEAKIVSVKPVAK